VGPLLNLNNRMIVEVFFCGVLNFILKFQVLNLLIYDFNEDDHLDVLTAGNMFVSEIETPRDNVWRWNKKFFSTNQPRK
jgi:hypothetical protein